MSRADWPGELGPDWPSACEALGVSAAGPVVRAGSVEGYGLVLCQEADGTRRTVISRLSRDVLRARDLDEMFPGSLMEYRPKRRQLIAERTGWVVYPAVGAPFVEGARLPLRRSELSPRVKSAIRRSMADAVAGELRYLRARTIEEYFIQWREDEADEGITDPDPPPLRVIDARHLVDPEHPGAITSAISALEALAMQPELPEGTLRSSKATPGSNLLVRATAASDLRRFSLVGCSMFWCG
jgi:hypothetical protein